MIKTLKYYALWNRDQASNNFNFCYFHNTFSEILLKYFVGFYKKKISFININKINKMSVRKKTLIFHFSKLYIFLSDLSFSEMHYLAISLNNSFASNIILLHIPK